MNSRSTPVDFEKTPSQPATWCPRVTALLPCYNAAAFLSRTLDCLAAQTWPELEILIGDDRSSDTTPEIVRNFAATRSNVRVIERDVNLGWLRNSNDLMSQASGELMFFAFHDDLIEPTYVERLIEGFRANPAAILAFSDMEVTELDGTSRIWRFTALDGVASALTRGKIMGRAGDGWWVPNRGLFRAEAFQRIGGIQPNACGEFSADWTWLLHMALLGEFVRIPEVLVRKYYKTDSLSKRWERTPEERAALRRAGVAEIRRSSLPFPQRLYLSAYVVGDGHLFPRSRHLSRRILQRIRRIWA
jgi:glycosyltransferase involved in cell wall biosynthesis